MFSYSLQITHPLLPVQAVAPHLALDTSLLRGGLLAVLGLQPEVNAECAGEREGARFPEGFVWGLVCEKTVFLIS